MIRFSLIIAIFTTTIALSLINGIVVDSDTLQIQSEIGNTELSIPQVLRDYQPRVIGESSGQFQKTVSVREKAIGILALTFLIALLLRPGRQVNASGVPEPPAAVESAQGDTALSVQSGTRVVDRGRPFIILGLTCIGIFLGGLATWGVMAPLESAAVAQGVVKVEMNRLVVDHPDGGTIGELLVREGTFVHKDQPVIRLDTSEIVSELEVLKRRRDRLILIRSRLIAEQANESKLIFPVDIADRAKHDRDLGEVLTYQTALFEANKAARVAEKRVRKRQIRQIELQTDGLRAELASTKKQLEIIKEEQDDLENLFQRGLTPQTRVLALRRENVKLHGKIGSLTSSIAQAQAAIARVELEMIELEKERQQSISDQLKSVAGSYFELIPQIRGLEHKLARHVLRAPASGVVFGLSKFTIGGVIGAGEKVLEIVPERSKLVVEIRIDPRDREVVQPGMRADVRLLPYESRNLKPIRGKLIHISADATEDERTSKRFYTGRVELSGEDLAAANITLWPGMPAQVMVPLGSRSALAYLADPITRYLERAMREE